ncbi:WD40 repeat domain-containing protein [Actinoallomurus sp. NBC_01490]|uniref:WD40 repeat domain-containing protein n=1 Tax=Actinoallomurus sp. NBC_01490 TaxID=2903557 RepID=UPI002E316EE3|nr:WD40 repeat domain-containing protein [Actinoallomurus sp. NBC_01490]
MGAVLVGAAVPTGVAVFRGGSDDRGSGHAKRAGTGAAASSTAPPLPRTPPPVAIPAHPTLRALGTLKGHHGQIDAFRFSPDGTALASIETRENGVLRLWDVADRKERATPVRSPDVIFKALAFSPDGRTLATGSEDRAQFWDAATLRPLGEIARSDSYSVEAFTAIAFSPDGESFVASGFDDGRIHFYDPVTRGPAGEPLGSEDAEDASAHILVFSPDGSTLASVDESGSEGVRLWDVAARKRRVKPSLDVFGGAQNLVISPDGATLAIDSDSRKVRFLATATGKEQGRPLGGHIGSVTGLAYSTDGRTVVTSDYSGLHFWDATTHKKRATVTIPGTPPTVEHPGRGITVTRPGTRTIMQFALSPDGRTVATAGAQAKTIALWRLE